jgi:hypothetical protein
VKDSTGHRDREEDVSNEMTISAASPFAGTVINVKDHGAAGNGSTDDTDRLKAVIAASEEGDAIYFPPGTYVIRDALEPKARQLYFSLTDKATIKAKRVVAGEFSIFEVESGPVEFHHLTLDLSKPEGTQPPRCKEEAALSKRAKTGTHLPERTRRTRKLVRGSWRGLLVALGNRRECVQCG